MKFAKWFSVLAIALASLTVQAGEKKEIALEDFYKAVLDSDHYEQARGEVVDARLAKLELTQTFRCPGCYEFEVTFEGTNDKVVEKFLTKLDLRTQTIEVTISE